MFINLAVGGGMYPLAPKDQFGNALPIAALKDGTWTDGVQPTIGGPEVDVVWDAQPGASTRTPIGLIGVQPGTCSVQMTLVKDGQPVQGGGGGALAIVTALSGIVF